MGGNDNGLFGTLLNGCSQIDAIEGRPGKHPCQDEYEKYADETFAPDKPAQEAALGTSKNWPRTRRSSSWAIRRSRRRKASASQFPWKEGDLKWFRSGDSRSSATRRSRRGPKPTAPIFVDTFKPSEGHDACKPVEHALDRTDPGLAHRRAGAPERTSARKPDAFDVTESDAERTGPPVGAKA